MYMCMSVCTHMRVLEYVCVCAHVFLCLCVCKFACTYVWGKWNVCAVNADGIHCHIQRIILVVMAIMHHVNYA